MDTSTAALEKSDFKYEQWAQEFRERIAAGDLAPGARLPSQNDLYATHGLSRATAERVYELLETEGLVVREHRRGVFVAAQPLHDRVTDTICVMSAGFGEYSTHPYYAQLIASAHQMAEADGMRLLLCSRSTQPDWERVGGLLLVSSSAQHIRRYANALPTQLPAVALLASAPGIAAVVADEFSGVQEATEHLLQLGHQRIAMLGMESYPTRRHEAYRMALLEADIEPVAQWLKIMPRQNATIPFEELGYRYMKEWLADDWKTLGCSALLCQNDDTAAGVLRALNEAGVRVPEDLALVGFDGTVVADRLTPRLTTVEMPLAAIVERGWKLLRARSHPLRSERPGAETVMLPTKLRIAGSTRAA